jgi:hypothetical protein
MIFTDEMFNSQGESVSLADMNTGSTAAVGTYAPRVKGRLVKIILLWAGEAATSLIENLRVELECTLWTPNRLRVGMVGGGIRTAPAVPLGAWEWPCDQPVMTDSPITGQYIHATAATPISSNLRVFGVFVTP